MNRKILVGITAIALTTTLTGCSQVHFCKNAVTIGEVKQNKEKTIIKEDKSTKAQSSSSKKITLKKDSKKKIKQNKKNKAKKSVATIWNAAKTARLKAAVNNWGKKSGQTYQFYDGKKNLKTKKGATYPGVLATNRFILNKKTIKIGYSPSGKAKYDYNVLAIANDDFKSWHNTYLFCLKNKKAIILLDQSKNGNPIMVKTVKDVSLNKIFSQLVK